MWIRAGAIGERGGRTRPHLDHARHPTSLSASRTQRLACHGEQPGEGKLQPIRSVCWCRRFFHQDRSTVYEPKVIRIHSTGLLFHLFSRVGQTDLKTFFFLGLSIFHIPAALLAGPRYSLSLMYLSYPGCITSRASILYLSHPDCITSRASILSLFFDVSFTSRLHY